jgi:predicted regulator of Ras-like GTPase activity (Roadblock/LC7/MglB family)
MTVDEDLRRNRLMFYRRDVERIDRCLSEFLKMSGAKSALLVDREGHLVARQGETLTIDMDTISALVAGSFAATKEMARLLGEDEFTALYHQGRRDNIQLSLVGDRTLLTVLFDDRTTLGMVRLYAAESTKKLEAVFDDILANGGAGKDADEDLSADYSDSAQGTLDDVFGG